MTDQAKQPDDREQRKGLRDLVKGIDDFRLLGSAVLGDAGQVTIPARVREALDLEGSSLFELYGSAELGFLILVGEPPSAADDFVTRVERRIATRASRRGTQTRKRRRRPATREPDPPRDDPPADL
jgi:bifunctional DNA-binding transcriptional regulator/antitoxin component of YhaV-PrlF toxin-antitoxin module